MNSDDKQTCSSYFTESQAYKDMIDTYNDTALRTNLTYLIARFLDNELTETELIKILYTMVKNREYNISDIKI